MGRWEGLKFRVKGNVKEKKYKSEIKLVTEKDNDFEGGFFHYIRLEEDTPNLKIDRDKIKKDHEIYISADPKRTQAVTTITIETKVS